MSGNGNRFFSLIPGFSVALQSIFPPEEPAGKFLKKSVAPAAINQERGQIFHPARVQDLGPKIKLVVFELATNGQERLKKLVFFSKHRSIAARFGETEPFGFDKTRPGPQYRGYDYLSLAFPGPTGRFAPVYFRIHFRGAAHSPYFLKVNAWEEKNEVIVRAALVFPNSCPYHLFSK